MPGGSGGTAGQLTAGDSSDNSAVTDLEDIDSKNTADNASDSEQVVTTNSIPDASGADTLHHNNGKIFLYIEPQRRKFLELIYRVFLSSIISTISFSE